MDRSSLRVLIAALVIGLQLGVSSPAQAEVTLRVHPALTLRYSDDPALGLEGAQITRAYESPTPPTPRQCKPRFMAGPATGIPLGIGAAVLGGTMVWAGTDPHGTLFSDSTGSQKGFIAGGAIVMASGLAAFIYSSIKLKKNLDTRARVCP